MAHKETTTTLIHGKPTYNHPTQTPKPTSHSHDNPSTTSYADEIETQHLEAPANERLKHQRLESDYDVHRRRYSRMVDPVAQKAVVDMEITLFVEPTPPNQAPVENTPRKALFAAGRPLEDLSYSMRNFLVVNPVGDPHVVLARVAIKEGRAVAGYIPPLPQSRRMMRDSESECSEICVGK